MTLERKDRQDWRDCYFDAADNYPLREKDLLPILPKVIDAFYRFGKNNCGEGASQVMVAADVNQAGNSGMSLSIFFPQAAGNIEGRNNAPYSLRLKYPLPDASGVDIAVLSDQLRLQTVLTGRIIDSPREKLRVIELLNGILRRPLNLKVGSYIERENSDWFASGGGWNFSQNKHFDTSLYDWAHGVSPATMQDYLSALREIMGGNIGINIVSLGDS